MGIRKAIGKALSERKSWEQKQAEKLQRMRTVRVKEESRAKLRAMEMKEHKRIEKARSIGRTAGGGRAGKLLAGLDRGMGAYMDTVNDMGMGGGPTKKKKTKKGFDPFDSSTW